MTQEEKDEYIRYAQQTLPYLQSQLSNERDCVADLLKSESELKKQVEQLTRWADNAMQDAAQSDVDTVRALHERNELREAYEDSQNMIRKLRAENEALVKRLADYDTRLTEVMPEDFKDWHQNSKDEWPLIAAGTIKRLREEDERMSSRLADIAAMNVTQEFKIIDLEKEIVELLNENDSKFSAMCRLREEIADWRAARDERDARLLDR